MARTLYTKMIGDRPVFSYCKTLVINGVPISNPTPEMIASDGWVVFVPPVVPPQPQTEPWMTEIMQAVKRMLSTETEELSDEDALDVAALFPTWISKVGEAVSVGERYWYDGKLWKVIQAHTVQSEWTPDVATSLFTEVSIVEWPEWVQPTGAQDAYMTGDKVKHVSRTWESLVDNNVWEPGTVGTENLWQDITPNE